MSVAFRSPLLLALCISNSWVPAALAQTDPLLDADDFFTDLPTVTAATRLEQQQRDLPAAVTLIDRAMIEASGAINIADLMRLVPGLQVFHVNANKHGVVSHGHGEEHPARMEVMVNGRSVYTAILSFVDWHALGITVADIDHIEVVRGPNVVSHGSNAVTGAINIVTRHPLQQQGHQLTLMGGSKGTRQYNLQSNAQVGVVDLHLSADFSKNDGFGDGFENDVNAIVPMNDGGEISQLAARAVYTPNLTDTFDLQFGISSGQFGMGNATHPNEIAPRDVDTNYQNLTWTRDLGEGSQLKVQGYHNYTRYDHTRRVLLSELAGEAPGSPILQFLTGGADDAEIVMDEEEGSTHRYDLELEYSRVINPHTRVIGGAGWRLDRIKSIPQLNTNRYISDPSYRAFGNIEWKPNSDWTLNSGAMVEHNPLIGTRLSPRLGINHHLDRSQTLRLSAAQAFRFPSQMDSYQFSQIVVPSTGIVLDIDSFTVEPPNPERIRGGELGYLLQLPSLRSSLDLRLFYEHIDRVIDGYRQENLADFGLFEANPEQEIWENRNTPTEWYNRGFEIQWQLRPRAGQLFNLAYGYLDSTGEIDRSKEGEPLEKASDRVPHHTLSLLASQELSPGFQLSGAYYYMSEVDWFKGDAVHTQRLDARLAKRVPLGRYQGSVALIAQNLLDNDYLEFEKNNRLGRRLLISVSIATP